MANIPTFKNLATLLVLAMAIPLASQQSAIASNACPQSWSEGESLILTRTNPKLVSTFDRQQGRLVEEQSKVTFGRKEALKQIYQHPLLPPDVEQDDRVMKLRFDDPFEELEQLPTKKRWLSEVTMTLNGEVSADNVVISLSYAGKTPVLVGKCRYESWKIRMSQDFGSQGILFKTLYYVPALGLVVRSLRTNQAGNVLGGVQYDAIRTERRKVK